MTEKTVSPQSGELSDTELDGVVGGVDSKADYKAELIAEKKKKAQEAYLTDVKADATSILSSFKTIVEGSFSPTTTAKSATSSASTHEHKSLQAAAAVFAGFNVYATTGHELTPAQVKTLDGLKDALGELAKFHEQEAKIKGVETKNGAKADAAIEKLTERLTDNLDKAVGAFADTFKPVDKVSGVAGRADTLVEKSATGLLGLTGGTELSAAIKQLTETTMDVPKVDKGISKPKALG